MLVERVTLRTEGHLNSSGYIPEISSIKEVWLGIHEIFFLSKIPEYFEGNGRVKLHAFRQ